MRGCLLEDVTTIACTFGGTDLSEVRLAATARDVVVEILRRGVDDSDVEALEAIGAIHLKRSWCWEDWAVYFDERPDLVHRLERALAAYPSSGCREALAAARSQPPDISAVASHASSRRPKMPGRRTPADESSVR